PGGGERSAGLLPCDTLRGVCPTKSVALHGIRFAYVLGPARVLAGLRWTCESVTGAASRLDLRLGARIMSVLSQPEANGALIQHICARYRALLDGGVILDTVREPECGYYLLGRLGRREARDLLMNGEYFE